MVYHSYPAQVQKVIFWIFAPKTNFWAYDFFFAGISLKDEQLIEMVQNSLQPQIERRLAAKKRLDDFTVSTLLKNVNAAIDDKCSKPSTSEEKLVKDLNKKTE